MKKTFIFSFIIIALSCHAQTGVDTMAQNKVTSDEQTEGIQAPENEIEVVNWRDIMPLDVTPDKDRYQNMRIGMTKKQVKKFIEILKKFSQKAKEWENTAKREDVRNFEKNLGKGLTTTGLGYTEFRAVSFAVDGKELRRVSYNGMMSSSYFAMMPVFYVDKNGECYLSMKGFDLGEFRITDGKTYESTTTAGNGGLFGTPTVVGHSSSKEITTYKPGGFRIYIKVSEINSYISMLQNGLKHFDEVKAESDLFK